MLSSCPLDIQQYDHISVGQSIEVRTIMNSYRANAVQIPL